jgi:hypothetical protein
MRNLITLAVVSIAVFLAVAPPVSADPWTFKTISEWETSPITVGAQMYTLVSTNWEGWVRFWYQNSPFVYDTDLDPQMNDTHHISRYLVFKVTIIDDPTTPQNEASINHMAQIAASCNADGGLTYAGIIDDDSDFSSPLFTFSLASPNLFMGLTSIIGVPNEFYMRVTWDPFPDGMTIYSSNLEFIQAEAPVPTENTTWGNIKALYE